MAKTLNHYSQQIRSLAPDAVALDRAKALGDILIDAKAAVKAAGKLWTEWLQSDCDLTPRTAGRFMTIAKRWNDQAFTDARTANPALAIREADKVLAANSSRKKAPKATQPVQPTPIAKADAEVTVWGPAEFLETKEDGEGVPFSDLFGWWMEQGVMPGNPEPYIPIHPKFESSRSDFDNRFFPERIKRELQKLRFATLNYLIDEWLNQPTEEELDSDVTGIKLRDTPLGKDLAWKPWTFVQTLGADKGKEVSYDCNIRNLASPVDGIDHHAVDQYFLGHPDWTSHFFWPQMQLDAEELFLEVMPKHSKAKGMRAAHKAKRPWKAGTYNYKDKEVTYEEWTA